MRDAIGAITTALCCVVMAMAAMAQAETTDTKNAASGSLQPVALRCEYDPEPRGLDITAPRFSWQLEAGAPELRNRTQSAYAVRVATSPALLADGVGDAWESGRVASSEQTHIVYDGAPLMSHQAYWWQVRVWDQDEQPGPWSDPATFRMGVLDPELWEARWIGYPAEDLPASYAHNGYHSATFDTAENTSEVILDLGETHRIKALQLYPAQPYDWHEDDPAFLFPLRYEIAVAREADFSDAMLLVEHRDADVAPPMQPRHNPETRVPLDYRFSPESGRYLRLRVTRLAEREPGIHAFALAELKVLNQEGENVALGASVAASDFIEQGGWARRYLVDGIIGAVEPEAVSNAQAATYLRNEFHLETRPVQATLYASALGWYQVRVNGNRMGDNIMSPEWTDYDQRVTYQSFDVTEWLQEGDNAIGAMLGAGWYAGHIAWYGPRIYGPQPYFLMQLELFFEDGSRQTWVSDDAWRATQEGPIRENDMLMGEYYDANYALPGWDRVDYVEEEHWTAARTAAVTPELTAQYNEPIRITEYLEPVAISEPAPGVHIFDLGQNIAGHCRITVDAPKDTRIQLRHAEVLHPDGSLYTENLRAARAIDTFVKGEDGLETFEPYFTYHGFRYVEVTGLTEAPTTEMLTGCVVHSDVAQASAFESSSELLNDLMTAIRWTQRGNMHSSPTDCPQRDERMGWMGDAQVFSQTALFNMDMARFFTKWLGDVRDAQKPDGQFPDFAPAPPAASYNAPAWTDAGVIVPWRVYENYGDVRVLEDNYPAAKLYIDRIHDLNPDHLYLEGRGANYNDWLNADTFVIDGFPDEGAAVPWDVLSTAFYAHSTDLLARMATVLGKDEEAAQYRSLFENIRTAFNKAYVDDAGRIEGDTQAGYALALHFDLLSVEQIPQARKHLLDGIARYNGHLSTGIQTTNRMMLELAAMGELELAYDLLLRRDFPSWGYMLDQGATTIWERWDGYVAERGFQNPGMNSFNHYAVGAVGEWVWRHVLGLNPDPEQPGYRHFYVAPRPGGNLDYARGYYDSMRGRIEIDWTREEDHLRLSVVVPPNCTATVVLPGSRDAVTIDGDTPLSDAVVGVLGIAEKQDAVQVTVGSGVYTFRATQVAS